MGYDKNLKLIRSVVESLASSMVVSFYPESIRRRTNLPLGIVLEKLENLVAEGWIEAKFVVKCPIDYNEVAICDSYEEAKELEPQMCLMCGEEFEVDDSFIYLEYYFNKEYLDDVEEEVKKNNQFRNQKMVVM